MSVTSRCSCGAEEAVEWRDDKGILNSVDDKPCYALYDHGLVVELRWYKNGLLHRDNGKPAIQNLYQSINKVNYQYWYENDVLINSEYYLP